jgi:tetratricopeptide (TPR) repeat protein
VVVTNVDWTLAYAGRSDDAIAANWRALALDRSYVQARSRLATERAARGRYEESLAEARQVADLSRQNPPSLALLVQVHAPLGRRGEAAAFLDQLLRLPPATDVSPVSIYATYFSLADGDNGFVWLEKAMQERSNGTVYRAVDRFMDRFRDDRRYLDAIRRIGLPDRSPILRSLPCDGWLSASTALR